MASFVTEVLAHSGRLEKEDLGTRISRLTRRVEEIKGEVCNMISKKYSEFLPSMQSAQGLITQVDKLSEDIDLLKSRIESEVRRDLHVSTGEFTDLKQQLERDSVVLSLLKQLQEFSTAIEEYNCALTEKKYVTGAQRLEEAQKCLKLLKSRKCFDLKILKSLSMELTIQKQNILYHLGEEWQKLIVWKFPPSKDTSSLESYLQTELHLYTEQSHKEEKTPMPPISSVLLAFSVLGELHSKLKSFDLPLDTDLENEKTSTVPLAEMLGDMIWEDLSECLIKNCLVYSIPTNSSKLQQYEEIIQSTEEFENALKEMRFLKGDTTDLLKYARNINSHFANKKCQDVIVAARNLMTSEIHNTVKIIPDSKINVPELPTPDEDNKLEVQKVSNTQYHEVMNLEPENTLDQHSFSLPTCRISESVKKLMELAYQTLLEATTSSDQCAVQLFYSVRNIFHLFHDVVPTYHKENLQKLPQLAAIHHNNCMYIAHHLLTLGHQFRLRLAPILCDGTATFVDLVPGFRRLGTECFLAQMRAQKGELLERLSSARNFSNMDDEENYSAASKAVRQVLHQLKRLGIVWQDVLPVNIYCKAMGTLLNTAISEVIGKITALEDISTEDGDRLYSLCKTVMDEGPQVFAPLSEESKNKKYQEEVPVYVPKWMPFKELMMMLQASLQEIGDRWADGKGPLAAAFSSSEVKALIRALFQNTERRAAALAKIK
ncbi:centromere/kinetochore protein zw10 homolog isoform X2 [Pan paniscus]|uniref:Centromere/kinetochore protein zw10 homolog n=2 Tax=Pan TaxID=9596 RepID=A0A2I3SFY1_PANTR|nr:centromere/kinetochore protein zw10 homolog isoform X2 [Pan paniscus]XP_009422481.1 centromere/kinetochore protein zw10 homolog isoform X4 [Pan troglodytes]XP_016874047.1 centromere/kinetochore protein zw10 homolog isoform X1 [Homo sapiens]XP_054226482.1 centromere/kinetochore protein zw10 homolog isoform X1 [Homo sapiens]|eukprot:XP_016874047.1 centromere/kinetochore protein zw10 homolog isoform X1 [Homo sapiens]